MVMSNCKLKKLIAYVKQFTIQNFDTRRMHIRLSHTCVQNIQNNVKYVTFVIIVISMSHYSKLIKLFNSSKILLLIFDPDDALQSLWVRVL